MVQQRGMDSGTDVQGCTTHVSVTHIRMSSYVKLCINLLPICYCCTSTWEDNPSLRQVWAIAMRRSMRNIPRRSRKALPLLHFATTAHRAACHHTMFVLNLSKFGIILSSVVSPARVVCGQSLPLIGQDLMKPFDLLIVANNTR